MRRHLLFTGLLFLSALVTTNAVELPLRKGSTTTDINTTRQRSPMLIPLAVDLSNTDLYVNFINPVGIATIVITNSNDSEVYRESSDTNLTSELHITISELQAGDYSITIYYGSTKLMGEFTLE